MKNILAVWLLASLPLTANAQQASDAKTGTASAIVTELEPGAQ
jgi:hypothetical protein